jgi:hypothetical protein
VEYLETIGTIGSRMCIAPKAVIALFVVHLLRRDASTDEETMDSASVAKQARHKDHVLPASNEEHNK